MGRPGHDLTLIFYYSFACIAFQLMLCFLVLASFLSTTPTRGIWEEGISVDMMSSPDWPVERFIV